MGELQDIQDSLNYLLGQNQVAGMRIFRDNQAAL